MAAKVHNKSCLPGYYSMRDVNEDSSSRGWSLFYGDKNIKNGQCYNGFTRNLTDGYPGYYDKDSLKQKMLEHEEVFKNQVYELHRLYRIQRNMMEEAKSKEVPIRASMEASSSSNLQQGSQVPPEDAWKWHTAGFPLLNSAGYGTASNSPISCTKGTVRSPYQNGSTSKDSGGALDSRPFKVRKKLFDLQLPADEYIDTEEGKKLREHKMSAVLSYAPSGNPKSGPESSAKTDFWIDASASASCLRNSVGLADLNEPLQIQEAMVPSPVGFLGHMSITGEMKGTYQPAKSNAGHCGFLKNSSIGSEVNERESLSNIFEAGSSKNNLSIVSQCLEQDKLHARFHTVQGAPNPVHHPSGMFPTGCGREELWRERALEFSDKSHDYSNVRNLEPFFSSSRFASSFAHSNSSRPKPPSSFTQKMTTLEPWQVNGFYHGSASGYKERIVPAGFGSLNCSRIDNVVASDRSIRHGFGNYQKGSFFTDSKPPSTGINLNEALVLQDLDVIDGNDKPDNPLSTLPWLRPKLPAHGNKDAANTRRSELSVDLNCLQASSSSDCENVTIKENGETQNVEKILGPPIFEMRDLKDDEQLSRASTSASIDCPHEEQKVRSEMKKRIIDINLECEPDEDIATEELTVEKEKKTVRGYIDLNSCISDSEDSLPPLYESKRAPHIEIDLEAPVLLESGDDDVPSKALENRIDRTQDEVLRNAAETILAISSFYSQIQNEDISSLPPERETLLWFVDVVSSFERLLSDDNNLQKKSFSEEIDEFEVMTLQIEETKEEDYMPIPFVPEFQKEEETVENTAPIRSRRGQSRRGRQRRDFQRDILPGMVSLSRHEVTEDLQIFGGLMRATGHSWDSGLTRRNGRGRGRRRAVVETETVVNTVPTSVCTTPLVQQQQQQVNVIEAAGGLEDRSLTGWGKTTRRPRRRQRYPANPPPPTVMLT